MLRSFKLIPPSNANVSAVLCASDVKEIDATSSFEIGPHGNTTTIPNRNEPPAVRTRVYASGHDLRYGVRIAVGYSDWIVFYSIPPAILESRGKHLSTPPVPQPPAQNAPNKPTQPEVPAFADPQEPVEIQGCHVGIVKGLVDLAVDSGELMVVWAFDVGGGASVFRLSGTAEEHVVVGREVVRFGEWGMLEGEVDGEVGNGGVGGEDRGGTVYQDSELEGWNTP